MFGWAGLLAGRWWVGQAFCEAVIWCGGCMRGLAGELAGGRVGWWTSWLVDELAGGRVVGHMEWVALQLGWMRRRAGFGRSWVVVV